MRVNPPTYPPFFVLNFVVILKNFNVFSNYFCHSNVSNLAIFCVIIFIIGETRAQISFFNVKMSEKECNLLLPTRIFKVDQSASRSELRPHLMNLIHLSHWYNPHLCIMCCKKFNMFYCKYGKRQWFIGFYNQWQLLFNIDVILTCLLTDLLFKFYLSAAVCILFETF